MSNNSKTFDFHNSKKKKKKKKKNQRKKKKKKKKNSMKIIKRLIPRNYTENQHADSCNLGNNTKCFD